MSKVKIGRIMVTMLALVTVGVLAATTACTPAEAQQLEGILKNVDTANGKVTITTKDGKTVTLTIGSGTSVDTGGASSNITALEPGTSVEIELDKDGRVARHIKARHTESEKEGTERGKLGKPESIVGWGILEVRVTDPPSANVTSAIVYLKNIEVHKVSGNTSENTTASGNTTASENNTSGWIPVIGAPPSFDLMSIIGVEQILGSANITAGSFTQIRMEVEKVVVTAGGANFTAEVPSGELKIVGQFNVGGGRKTVLTLDFDGEKSLIVTGSGKAIFKPVVKLLTDNEGKPNSENEGKSNRGQSTENEGKGKSEGKDK
ncbi:MAG: DUF4382 domain-containing protein [Chloroflexi bacterium]|nr:DUF4382 domain-containing protein [Chloroflexota bacterium]